MSQDWQVVGAWAAAGGALVVATVQLCGTAFWAGSVTARLKALEEQAKPIARLQQDMAALGAEIRNLITRLNAHDAAVGAGAGRSRRRPAPETTDEQET
ncbi:MAG TPA: hypothetical protein VG248_17160 [Caulobacteraceae bacterium]|jgi:hypothetical protein|nr:hypothetical protein [Caulobacteraceae bacterium]